MADFIVKGLILAVALLATGLVVIDESDVVIRFEPRENIATTTPVRLDIVADTKVPINVVSGTITYPSERLSIAVERSPASPVDIWLTGPTNDPKLGEIAFAGGTSSTTGITGTQILFSITVTATTSEYAELSAKDLEVYAHDGQGQLVKTRHEIYAFNRPEDTELLGGGGGALSEEDVDVLKSRADFDGDGSVSLVDLSIILMKLVGPYSKAHDVNNDEKVDLADLSALLTVIGK